MLLVSSIIVGVLFGLATYLIMQGSFVRVLFGVIILGNAANLAVLIMSGSPVDGTAPIAVGDISQSVDPLPQALVLTAIVIGFGVAAYLVFLLYRIFLDWKTTDVRALFAADNPDAIPAPDKEEGA